MPSRVDPDSKSPILILGGTGTVGSRIVNQLAAASIPALVASRSGTAPESEHLTGVKFNWFDETTFNAPFEVAGDTGIRAVYIIAPPIIDSGPVMKAFIDRALAKGTRRFVIQSATPIDAGHRMGMGQIHKYLRDLGNEGKADWCALRPTWFQENFSTQANHIDSIRNERKIYSATGIGKLPWVSADDIAEVAVEVLTQKDPPHTEYKLLGPNNLSYDDVAHELSQVLGKRIKHVDLPREDYEERMLVYGMPEDYVKVMSNLEHAISLQAEHRMNDTVEQLLGRKPKSFHDTIKEAMAIWQ